MFRVALFIKIIFIVFLFGSFILTNIATQKEKEKSSFQLQEGLT